jgi:hypothetical protein
MAGVVGVSSAFALLAGFTGCSDEEEPPAGAQAGAGGYAAMGGGGAGGDGSVADGAVPMGLDQAPAPTALGKLTLAKAAADVVGIGRFGLVLRADKDADVLDLADPKNPVLLGTIPTAGKVTAVDYDEEREIALIADATGSLRVVNTAAGDDPLVIGTIDLGASLANPTAVARVGDRVFVVAGARVQPVGLGGDTAKATLTAEAPVTLSAPATHMVAGGGSLFVGFASGTVEAWSAPAGAAAPQKLSSLALGGELRGLVARGSKVLGLAKTAGLRVADFGAPEAPSIVYTNAELGDAKLGRLFGRTLLVGLERGLVSTIDVSSFSEPRAVSSTKGALPAWIALVDGNLVSGSATELSVSGVPLHLTGRVPEAQRQAFPRYGQIPIGFSRAIDPASATASTVKLTCAATAVAGKPVVSPDGLNLWFRADGNLPSAADCTLDVSGVKDRAGVGMTAGGHGATFAFKTSDTPVGSVTNKGSKYKHTIDGQMTDWNATATQFEYFDVVAAKGMYTYFYADFDGTNLWILNDWFYNGDKISPDCYNRFRVWTGGGAEQWEVRAYGDQRVQVSKNGQVVDPQAAGVKGAAYYGSSPNRKDPHTIYEIALPAKAGGWGVQLHDPGPTFACSKLEGDPTSIAGNSSGASGSTSTTIDPTKRPTAPESPAPVAPQDGATSVALSPSLTWTTPDTWEKFVGFRVQIGQDQDLKKLVFDRAVGPGSARVPGGVLRNGKKYFWRVVANNPAGSTLGPTRSFTTTSGTACTEPGTADCDGNPQNGCETTTSSDPNNCGSCGNKCSPSGENVLPTCGASTCGFTCVKGYGNCDGNAQNGCEVNTDTSLTNCGQCGKECTGQQTCVAGSCTSPPDAGPDGAGGSAGSGGFAGMGGSGGTGGTAGTDAGDAKLDGTGGSAGGDAGADVSSDGGAGAAGDAAADVQFEAGTPIQLSNMTEVTGLGVMSTHAYFGGPSTGLVRVLIGGGASQVVVAGETVSGALAFDATSVYWFGYTAGYVIKKADLGGGAATTIVPAGQSFGLGMAVDMTGVYFTNPTAGRVYVVPTGGGALSAVASSQSYPYDIRIDGTYAYWINAIVQAGMQNPRAVMKSTKTVGGTPVQLASSASANLKGIAIDTDYVYWTESDATSGATKRVPKAGGQALTLATPKVPGSVATDGVNVYYVDGQSIMRVPVGGGAAVPVVTGQMGMGSIFVDSAWVYFYAMGPVMGVFKVAK